MYDCMAAPGYGPQSPVVDRGIALHKMIRMVGGWIRDRGGVHAGITSDGWIVSELDRPMILVYTGHDRSGRRVVFEFYGE